MLISLLNALLVSLSRKISRQQFEMLLHELHDFCAEHVSHAVTASGLHKVLHEDHSHLHASGHTPNRVGEEYVAAASEEGHEQGWSYTNILHYHSILIHDGPVHARVCQPNSDDSTTDSVKMAIERIYYLRLCQCQPLMPGNKELPQQGIKVKVNALRHCCAQKRCLQSLEKSSPS